MENIDTNFYVKIDDDRLCNEKALADRKSDNKKQPQEQQQEQRSWPLQWGPVSDYKNLWTTDYKLNM